MDLHPMNMDAIPNSFYRTWCYPDRSTMFKIESSNINNVKLSSILIEEVVIIYYLLFHMQIK